MFVRIRKNEETLIYFEKLKLHSRATLDKNLK